VLQAFMERLGLWGDGAMFSSFEEFLDTVQKKGLGMLPFYFLVIAVAVKHFVWFIF